VSPRRLTRLQLALLAIVSAGAAVRFSTLDVQSLWLDEGITVRLLRMDLGAMLSQVHKRELTGPLYYVLAWLWTRPFGTGEVGVRTLSALLGTATIPLAYALGRQLLSRRAGLVAAALAAFSPLLVWYSQEARSYALLVPMSGLTILLFQRALDERGGERASSLALWRWAVAAALALTTHYFALFLVIPQAAWLLLRGQPRRYVVRAVLGVGAAGAALLPLALYQANHGGSAYIKNIALGTRLAQVPKQFLVGYASPGEVPIAVAAAVLAAFGLWLALTRTDAQERRGLGIAAAFVAAAVGIPLLLSVAGADYLLTRNVIGGCLPFVLVLAAGFGARRAGLAGPLAAAALCALGLAAIVGIDLKPEFQRNDWRAAARALGPARTSRAIVISPVNGSIVLGVYTHRLRQFPSQPVAVREIDLLAVAGRLPGETGRPPRPPSPTLPGFRVVERRDASTFTLIRLRAEKPLPQTTGSLDLLRLDPHLSDRVLQTP
jgi:hypothetical protein